MAYEPGKGFKEPRGGRGTEPSIDEITAQFANEGNELDHLFALIQFSGKWADTLLLGRLSAEQCNAMKDMMWDEAMDSEEGMLSLIHI